MSKNRELLQPHTHLQQIGVTKPMIVKNNYNPLKRYFRQKAKYVFLGLFAVIFSNFPQDLVGKANAATTINTPLSTKGSQIVDSTGKPVLLRGVNWFGVEGNLHVPHGLWARDYKDMLAQIKSLGYNVIRLPFSVQSLRSSTISGIDFSIGSNKDLQGKTPLQVMDLVIQEAQRQGLLVLLDNHTLSDNDPAIPELWYNDKFTEADWINTWTMLATRYRNQTNVIGADLKNEPHGIASWGSGNEATDWRLAAERCGNAIEAVNPNWLIIVEGVENNVPGQKLSGHWWGSNLEGVGQYPVRLAVTKQLVYSPHEYGLGVYNQSWFSDPTFPNNLYDRWETGFNYIATKGIAPILIGEFGGRQVDSSSSEGIWQRQLVDFIGKKNLSFTYWSWNPNSKDTGGILLDDWHTVDAAKQQLLSTLLSAAIPTPTPVPIPTPTPVPSPVPSPELKAQAIIQSDWQTGYCVNLLVTNQGNKSTNNWVLTFNLNQGTITNSWNGNFNSQGTMYQVTPPDWERVIQPNQTVQLGYCAQKTGPNYKPTNFSATTSNPTPVPSSELKTQAIIQSDWQTGYCVNLLVTNQGNKSTNNWVLTFNLNQGTISNSWNGSFNSQGTMYQVTPPDWERVIQPNQTAQLGYCAQKTGPNYKPTNFSATSS